MKKSQNGRNEDFSYYFGLMIEGSRAGSMPRTYGSGSGRSKNIRIRIPNTGFKSVIEHKINLRWAYMLWYVLKHKKSRNCFD